MSLKAKVYISTVIAAGFLALAIAARYWHVDNPSLFLAILGLSVFASFLKVTISGIPGSMSMNFMLAMLAVTRLSLGEAVLIGVVSSVVQTLWNRKTWKKRIIVLFNVSLIAAVIGICYAAFHSVLLNRVVSGNFTRLCVISMLYFLINTAAVACVISLTGHGTAWKTWRESYSWSCAYYLLGASAVGIFDLVERTFNLETALLTLPLVFIGYRSYRMRIDALEKSQTYADGQRRHAEEVATLHLRTIRALALAIEAKDTTTSEHLHRVQTYALAIGRKMGLTEEELQALGAAAILHDIGKIAVPEWVISKPGKLNREEFEKMKIHPLVGAQIIESVRFPYPVAPIVSAHHEKWDGTGYPFGLAGEAIPVGARILSVVDCLDALASDRQYRRALPVDHAMEFLRSESGKAFDPNVVEILSGNYQELEQLAHVTLKEDNLTLSLKARIEPGNAPHAGLETGHLRLSHSRGTSQANLLESLRHSSTEFLQLEAVDDLLAGKKTVPDLMTGLAALLHDAIPFETLALFLSDGEFLTPQFVSGPEQESLRLLKIGIGSGQSGWVAEYHLPLLNGNPVNEFSSTGIISSTFELRSSLAVPLDTEKGVMGVLTLYSKETDAFHGGHLRLCMGIRSRLAYALETAAASAAERAAAGYYPGSNLPNMGALLNYLDAILAKHSGLESLWLWMITLNGTPPSPAVDCLQTSVEGFGPATRFLARLSPSEFVVVVQRRGHRAPALEQTLAAALARSGFDLEIKTGSARAFTDATDAEGLLVAAMRRLQVCNKGEIKSITGLEALTRGVNGRSSDRTPLNLGATGAPRQTESKVKA